MPAKKKKSASGNPKKEKSSQAPKLSPSTMVPAEQTPFHILGIGASAGGLEALKGFFGEMPADCGMAFVVVQHLDPNHESLMKGLLEQITDLPVQDAQNNERIEPNRVYLKPPGEDVIVRDGTLILTPIKVSDRPRLPIDIFFLVTRQPVPGYDHPGDALFQGPEIVRCFDEKSIAALVAAERSGR